MEVNFVSWDEAESALRNIRQKVFVEEQNVPSNMEWDADDKKAIHILGKEGNRPVACARIVNDNYLGRVAVLKDYRGHGWGSRLIRAAEQHLIEKRKSRLSLNAQANSYKFYLDNGYVPDDEMMWDANIPHLKMSKLLLHPSSTGDFYILKEDETSYTSELPVASAVWFQIASSQSKREINIQIRDLEHSVFNNPNCISNLSKFLRASEKRKIRILINQEIPGLSEHPLLRLQQRISSRLIIRSSAMEADSDNIGNHIIFDQHGYLRFDFRNTYCCFSSPLSIKKHKANFERYWLASKQLLEGKRLKL